MKCQTWHLEYHRIGKSEGILELTIIIVLVTRTVKSLKKRDFRRDDASWGPVVVSNIQASSKSGFFIASPGIERCSRDGLFCTAQATIDTKFPNIALGHDTLRRSPYHHNTENLGLVSSNIVPWTTCQQSRKAGARQMGEMAKR